MEPEFTAKKIKLLQPLERGDERYDVGALVVVRGAGEAEPTDGSPSVTKGQAKALIERKAAQPA